MCYYPPRFLEGTRVRVIRHGSDPKYAREGVVVQMFGGATCGVFDVIFDGDDYRSTCSEWDRVERIYENEERKAPPEKEVPEESEVDLRSLLQDAWRRRGGA